MGDGKTRNHSNINTTGVISFDQVAMFVSLVGQILVNEEIQRLNVFHLLHSENICVQFANSLRSNSLGGVFGQRTFEILVAKVWFRGFLELKTREQVLYVEGTHANRGNSILNGLWCWRSKQLLGSADGNRLR